METREENVTKTEEQSPASQAEPSLGKFKSVDALLHAYGELEAEFTRRSQRLKALEEADKEKAENAPLPSQTAEGAQGEDLYRAVMQNESVKARVLSDYLNSLKGVPLLSGSGSGISAPADRPKSIAEAGKLALGYFKSGK